MRALILLLSGLVPMALGPGKGGAAARCPLPLEWRLGAGILGAAWGWCMAGIAYAPDATHRVVGLPLPVFLGVKVGGAWTDPLPAVTVPFLLLDILLGALLAGRITERVWMRLRPGGTRRL